MQIVNGADRGQTTLTPIPSPSRWEGEGRSPSNAGKTWFAAVNLDRR